jgi:hypothetical protein
MSDAGVHPGHSQSPEAAAAARARLRALARERPGPRELLKTIGPLEIAVLVVLLFAALAVFLVYTFSVLPDQVGAVQLSSTIDANRTKIAELQKQVDNPGAVHDEVALVQASLDTFRGTYLKPRMAGRVAILETVRNLTRETGVQLASPVSFRTTISSGGEEDESKQRQRARKSKESVTSYSSLALDFSITGTYPQLRRFIDSFERSSQFIVIDSVGLSTEKDVPDAEGQPRRASAGGAGDLLTLDIAMTAYFQPETPPGIAAPSSLDPAAGQ